jgi:hypothetical protein
VGYRESTVRGLNISAHWGVCAVGAGLLLAGGCRGGRTAAGAGDGGREGGAGRVRGSVLVLPTDSTGDDLYGRAGDLALRAGDGAAAVFATGPDRAKTRPLRGSLVDLVAGEGGRRGDGLVWWRTGVVGPDGAFVPVVATSVVPMRCDGGDEGVKIVGDAGAARVETHACVKGEGVFELESRLLRSAAGGGRIADELNTGASVLYAARVGSRWEESVETDWLAFGGGGVAGALRWDRPRAVTRRVIRIAAEVFRAEARVAWEGTRAVRTLHVARGDALDAIARLPGARARARVRFGDARGGTLALLDARGEELGAFERTGDVAEIATPEGFGDAVTVRDHAGIPRVARAALAGTIALGPARMGVIRATYVDEQGAGAPTHVLFTGLEGTPDPTPTSAPRRFAAKGTVYALDGWAEVPVAPGRYRVVGTRGPAHGLSVREVTVTDGAVTEVRDTLAREVDTSAYTAADFHVHAGPSPDSSVPLDARVASLVCNGIALAVATDHNAVTDYGPTVRALGLDRWIDTVPGDELTTSGTALGHFNVFPVAGAGYGAALPYHGVTATEIVRAARQASAAVLQVNHPRMEPGLGYLNLTGFDARTGGAGRGFEGRFEALEVFNGMHLEEPERVREALRDLVGLARAGLRVAPTGNSDSHHLVYEEAGWPRTYVRAGAEPPRTRITRVFDGVRAGATTVSSGPLVELWVDGMQPGETLLRPGGARRVRARVRVSAARWVPVERVEWWVNDRVAVTIPVPPVDPAGTAGPVRFERTVDLSLSADSVIFAWASAEAPLPHVLPAYPRARALGFTGMVWVDADGDAIVRVPPAPPDAAAEPALVARTR